VLYKSGAALVARRNSIAVILHGAGIGSHATRLLVSGARRCGASGCCRCWRGTWRLAWTR
jgi:hypothetical protein